MGPYTKRFEKLMSSHPGLREVLNTAVEEWRLPGWIRGRLRHQFGVEVKQEEMEGYMRELWKGSPEPGGEESEVEESRDEQRPVIEGEPVLDPPVDDVAPTAAVVQAPPHPSVVTRAEIVQEGHRVVRNLLEDVKADRSSDAYSVLELMCVNEFVDARLKSREIDVMELYKAQNQGRQLALRAEQLKRQSKLDEAKVEKLQLDIHVLRLKIREIRQKTQDAKKAKREGRAFNYERALNQISRVIGLRGPEEFRIEKQAQERA